MPDAASTIADSVKSFAKDITKFLEAARAKKAATLKKAGKDPEKELVAVTFRYSSGAGSVSRSPEKQAEYVSEGTSWTCAGSHMVDKARHVEMLFGAPGKKPGVSWKIDLAFGSGDQHFMTLGGLKTRWKSLMSTHGLKNHKGKDGWGDGDAFHFELPDSKVPKGDKRVQACLIHYAKITRVDGKKRNAKFESDSNWKAALKEHLKKYEAQAEKQKEEAHRKEMKKLRLEGTSKSSESLLRSSNKTGSAGGKPFADILPASPFDSGKLTAKKISIGNAMVWDSLARSIFEKLGLSETSGFDVKLSCGVTYEHITYENLSQSFIRNIVPHVALIYNTPAAKMMAMTVDVTGEIVLTKSALTPKGSFIFTFKLTSPIDTEKGRIEIEIDGAKAKASLR